jgi:molybdate transport system permease protein
VAIYDAVESGDGHLARVLVLIVSATAIAILWPANRMARRAWPGTSI